MAIAHPGSDPRPEKIRLSARLESFDSYWQAPEDLEAGYASFFKYYQHNYLPLLPADRSTSILVVSCGPGYLINVLDTAGYTNVLGIDSDPEKIAAARRRKLNCRTAEAFPFLADSDAEYDVIIAEQELNHLTMDETLGFLKLCRARLSPGGSIVVYGLNGSNPLVGAENLAQNIDHFYTFTEHSLVQLLELGGFTDVSVHPLRIYVFWTNPLNYVGLAVTGVFELACRMMFKLYGKKVTILSKKIAAKARRP